MVEEFGIEAIENDEDYYLSNMYNFIGNIYEIDLDKDIAEQLNNIVRKIKKQTRDSGVANKDFKSNAILHVCIALKT